MLEIYTDGSSRGNPGPGGWGVILIGEKTVLELGGSEAQTTNNRMEMMAVIEGLKKARGYAAREVAVYSDSQYVIKGATEWLTNWKKNNWKNSQKKDVLNRDLWETLDTLLQNNSITWHYIRGHNGHSLNERADAIATQSADRELFDLYNGSREEYPFV